MLHTSECIYQLLNFRAMFFWCCAVAKLCQFLPASTFDAPVCGAGAEAPAGWLVYSGGEGLQAEYVVDLLADVEVFLDHGDDV